MIKNPATLIFDKQTHRWISCGIISLAIAGIYSIILVLVRIPNISKLINKILDVSKIFNTALVIHVNLSVLIWLTSITVVLWFIKLEIHEYNYTRKNKYSFLHSLIKISNTQNYYCAILGIILITFSPINSEHIVIKSNYIPMLDNILFIIGLCCFGISILLTAIHILLENLYNFYKKIFIYKLNNLNLLNLYIFKITSSLLVILGFFCIVISYNDLKFLTEDIQINIDFFYENLYWSIGHMLQFVYTQSFIYVIYLIYHNYINDNNNDQRSKRLTNISILSLIINALLASVILLGHGYKIADNAEFKNFFTNHMIYCGGISPVIFICYIIIDYILNIGVKNYNESKSDNKNIELYRKLFTVNVITSIIIFMIGCVIGSRIIGSNVTVPSHYHGVIVGITMSFMGLVYYYFINKAYDIFINKIKIAIKQLYIIFIGQLIHISALAAAGGYGILRKDPNNTGIKTITKIYMGLMGFGGIIAIIGGLIFSIIAVKLMLQINKKHNQFK